MIFEDRADAGERLAERLSPFAGDKKALVLGLPRGGLVVAERISKRLGVPLDAFIVRKLRAPDQPELALGALAETGQLLWNRQIVDSLGLTPEALQEELDLQRREVAKKRLLYRAGRGLPKLAGRTVLLVDDGIATGATFMAALEALRAAGPARLVAAAPVCPASVLRELRGMADSVCVLHAPELLGSVGSFYRDFRQVEDAEVLEILSAQAKRDRISRT